MSEVKGNDDHRGHTTIPMVHAFQVLKTWISRVEYCESKIPNNYPNTMRASVPAPDNRRL